MPFRDLFLFGCFAALMPLVLFHPYVGALAWVVFGLANPHRFTFGAAYEFPFSLIIAIVTCVGIVLTRDHRQMKGGAAGAVLIVLTVWMTITTISALTPLEAVPMWIRVMKILLMTFVLIALLHTRRHAELLAGLIALCIGFFAVKGGIFTIVTGGTGVVNGPEGSVMEGNNSLGVAGVMTIPLVLHFYNRTRSRWARLGLAVCLALFAMAILGSYSRGAVLALAAMGVFLFLRSSNKPLTIAILLTTVLFLIPLMPSQWDQRMHTVETYEQESSAMGRIYAWQGAYNIAVDRILGGGFEYPSEEVRARYYPGPYVSVAHSIYFQVLGEHGFIGLALWGLFWILVWRQTSWTRSKARQRAELQWAYSLVSMVQVSLVGYAVGGAFLNLAFWDMPYYLWAVVVVTQYVVRQTIADHVAAPAPREPLRPVGLAARPTRSHLVS